MKARKGFVIRHYHYGIGYRIVDPTDALYPQVNGVVEPNEKEVWMWGVMQEEFTAESLAEAAAEHFNEPMEKAAAEAAAWIEKLTVHHLLDGVPPRFPGMPG